MNCPFCGKPVAVRICDDEGNLHPDEYEQDPWSGLGFILYHDTSMAAEGCPIAHGRSGQLGTRIYDSRQEAESAWKTCEERKENA